MTYIRLAGGPAGRRAGRKEVGREAVPGRLSVPQLRRVSWQDAGCRNRGSRDRTLGQRQMTKRMYPTTTVIYSRYISPAPPLQPANPPAHGPTRSPSRPLARHTRSARLPASPSIVRQTEGRVISANVLYTDIRFHKEQLRKNIANIRHRILRKLSRYRIVIN